jgi:signal peptidase I
MLKKPLQGLPGDVDLVRGAIVLDLLRHRAFRRKDYHNLGLLLNSSLSAHKLARMSSFLSCRGGRTTAMLVQSRNNFLSRSPPFGSSSSRSFAIRRKTFRQRKVEPEVEKKPVEKVIDMAEEDIVWKAYSKRLPFLPLSFERRRAMFHRIPLWLALCFFMFYRETAPFLIASQTGPSNMPTISPDETDIFFYSLWWMWKQRLFGLKPRPKVGDMVLIRYPSGRIGLKRVVALAGHSVRRYGLYVQLFVKQDPERLGIPSHDDDDPMYAWIDRTCAWDTGERLEGVQEAARKIVIPEDHVWVEGDNPAMSMDSRSFGPVPVEWLLGRIVGRLWPLWRQHMLQQHSWRDRPHPMPLDDRTIAELNLHREKKQPEKDDSVQES